jgi:hypothetical protein
MTYLSVDLWIIIHVIVYHGTCQPFAECVGYIVTDEGSAVSEKGVCYGQLVYLQLMMLKCSA